MRILIRTFNNHINSKSGQELPTEQKRGTKEWELFEALLFKALARLDNGIKIEVQEENPLVPDIEGHWNKKIYVHQTKRTRPEGNLYYMQMHCRELFTLDINGWGCENSSYKGFMPDQVDETDATAFCRLKSDHLIASGESKCDQPIETDMTPARFILVPTQTPRDYTLKHHSPITMRYFIESVQAWANETENHIVFKLHPHGRDMEPFIDTSEYVHKAEGNIHELIKRASGLFVINSGTGFEALIHGKPVCTFGSCDYNLVTHNGDVRRLDEARNFIYSYKEEWRKIGYQFVYWYWYKHAYDVNDVRAVDRLTEYLRGVL